ncbi:hypothetical protein T484DRAFT_1793735 [Baffinella frigidus]|nr:hypothetical protein T484DRAFT_1793735 [Cryptophyta sp. CCMP2293]
MGGGRAIALAFVALACAAVAMHSAHRQTELLAAMPPYMSSLEQKAPSQSALLRQQQLMDGLVVDPNSENPSADFYADNDDGAYDNEDDVEDAGEGNILPGWTHPELLDKPRPEDVQSFATGESGAVLKPQDYERTPGAAKTATATRQASEKLTRQMTKTHADAADSKAAIEKLTQQMTKTHAEAADAKAAIEKLTRQMTKTHAEAADAKAVYDAEEEKSKGLKKEYKEQYRHQLYPLHPVTCPEKAKGLKKEYAEYHQQWYPHAP